MKSLLVALLVAFAGQIAVAQTVNGTKFNQCKAIVQDRERLTCFDGLVVEASDSSKPKPIIKQQGKWEVREKVSHQHG